MTTTLDQRPPAHPSPPAVPAPPRASAQRFALAVLAAVLVGLAIRATIGLTDDAPATDETAYLRSGVALVEGDGFSREGHPELHFPPLIPFVLGMSSRVFGDPHTGTVVLTCLASTALIVPLALLGRRVAGPRAGIATAWVAALAPGLSTSVVNRGAGSEAVYMLLLVGAVWLVVSSVDHHGAARAGRVAAAGGLVGLAYLTRPEGLFVGVPLGLAVIAVGGREGGDRRHRLLSAGRLAVVFAAPIVACAVPYAAYLHRHTGEWQLSGKTQDASIEAWHAVARGDREARDSVLYQLDETGLSFTADRASLTRLALDDPGGYLGIVGTNLGSLGAAVTSPESGQVLSWLLLPTPVWILAGYGVWRFRRTRTVRLILVVALVPVAAITVAFFVQPRYLMLTVALATVPAGAALVSLPARWLRTGTALVVGMLLLSTVQGFRGPAGWWHPSDHSDQRAAGEWIAENTAPGTRIMSRSMVVEYYAERPTMAIPYADIGQILDYGRHYGAQYIVVDWYTVRRLRPQLAPLRDGQGVPGLRLVHEVRREARTTRVFALDPAPAVSDEVGPSLGFMGDS